jgi:hypothetical protein
MGGRKESEERLTDQVAEGHEALADVPAASHWSSRIL